MTQVDHCTELNRYAHEMYRNFHLIPLSLCISFGFQPEIHNNKHFMQMTSFGMVACPSLQEKSLLYGWNSKWGRELQT